MRTLVVLFLGVSACLAQVPTPVLPVFFPPQLKDYLALSDDQATKISGLNSQLRSFQSDKGQRQIQVQLEIAQETAKPSPDPMELGVRYFELEAIRRQLDDQQKSTVSQIQALLTADQKTKLTALQQALSLYPTACSAVGQNLMTVPAPAALIPVISSVPVISPGISFGVLTSIPSPACAGTAVARSGDFVFSPGPAQP
jgi:hypothetical protein